MIETKDLFAKSDLIPVIIQDRETKDILTPKDIDESVKRLCYTISEGLNLAFAGGCLHAL